MYNIYTIIYIINITSALWIFFFPEMLERKDWAVAVKIFLSDYTAYKNKMTLSKYFILKTFLLLREALLNCFL